MTDELEIRVTNRVATLTFNRPKVRNALTPVLLQHLIAAIGRLEADAEVRVLVLTGAGESFSSGGDRDFLRELTAMTPEQVAGTVYRSFAGAAKAIKLCAKPTVAAVNGAAVGAGCELAVACDFRLVTPATVFHENWIELGIVPPLGGMFLLPRLIGLERAANMVMRGAKVGGEEAVAIGLASQLVAADRLAEAARGLAEDLAARSPRALAIAKAGLRRGMEGTLAGEWEFNIQAQSALITGPDFREAVAAIAEKRKPVF